MKTSSALQSLINASFVNGELSAKEKDVLVYRAVAEGLNQDEFEIYLDSLVYRSNSDKKGFLNKILYQLFQVSEKKSGDAVINGLNRLSI